MPHIATHDREFLGHGSLAKVPLPFKAALKGRALCIISSVLVDILFSFKDILNSQLEDPLDGLRSCTEP